MGLDVSVVAGWGRGNETSVLTLNFTVSSTSTCKDSGGDAECSERCAGSVVPTIDFLATLTPGRDTKGGTDGATNLAVFKSGTDYELRACGEKVTLDFSSTPGSYGSKKHYIVRLN